jgi:hypothetical protein
MRCKNTNAKLMPTRLLTHEDRRNLLFFNSMYDRERCPECGARILPESGCCYCPTCGWGRCG